MSVINPVVTVLMPVYNGKKYLSETIESILSQTYKDFEFLIINDCSTDNSVEIINSYNDDRIKLIQNKKNKGQSKTMNKGINLASGKYIARIDQDDVSYENRLKMQINKISGLQKTIVGSWSHAINEKSEIVGLIEHPITSELIIDSLSISSSFSHSSIFIEKKDLVKLGGYNEKYKIAMDWDLWIKAATNNYHFYNIPEYLIGLRRHSKQASKNFNGEKILNSETLDLIGKSKLLIRTKKNSNAFIGWRYYHEIKNIKYHYSPVKAFIKILFYLFKLFPLIQFIKILFFHKIINNPSKLYNAPIVYKKNEVFIKKKI